MREPIVRTSSLVAVVLVLMVAATGALAAAGCGGSGGTTGTSSSPSATASRGAPSPLPSALTETYSNDAFGFAFRYPSGFTVREQPDFLTGEGTVFDLALLPTAETAEAYGIEGGDGVRLAVWVYEMDDTWRGLDPVSYTHLTLPTNREV